MTLCNSQSYPYPTAFIPTSEFSHRVRDRSLPYLPIPGISTPVQHRISWEISHFTYPIPARYLALTLEQVLVLAGHTAFAKKKSVRCANVPPTHFGPNFGDAAPQFLSRLQSSPAQNMPDIESSCPIHSVVVPSKLSGPDDKNHDAMANEPSTAENSTPSPSRHRRVILYFGTSCLQICLISTSGVGGVTAVMSQVEGPVFPKKWKSMNGQALRRKMTLIFSWESAREHMSIIKIKHHPGFLEST